MKKTDFSQPVKKFIQSVDSLLHPDQTIEEALSSLKKTHSDEKIVYFYVVDDKEELIGVVSTRNLLLKDLDIKIKDIMERSVVSVLEEQTLQEAMQVLISHHLLAIPVIDSNQKLLGVVDVRLYLEEHAQLGKVKGKEDFFLALGFVLEEGNHRDFLANYKNRVPWILCNMIGGLACAVISRLFQTVLTKAIVLAMFIPLVLSLSESISMQTMTHSFMFIRNHKLNWKEIINRVMNESKVVMALALSYAVVVGALSLFWNEGVKPSIIIGTGILFSVSISGCLGIVIPFILHTRKLDPKGGAGPLVLSIADIITTLIYLTTAAVVLYI